jgi:hypothetical protein
MFQKKMEKVKKRQQTYSTDIPMNDCGSETMQIFDTLRNFFDLGKDEITNHKQRTRCDQDEFLPVCQVVLDKVLDDASSRIVRQH